MHEKDFQAWHKRKAALNRSTYTRYFHEREVWWMAIGHNIGDEEDGKGKNFARPVLIVRNFNNRLLLGVPLSTAKKTGAYYHLLSLADSTSLALLSQLRSYDAKRLINKLGVVTRQDFRIVQRKLTAIIAKEP
jgi:mRNA interferase MazF